MEDDEIDDNVSECLNDEDYQPEHGKEQDFLLGKIGEDELENPAKRKRLRPGNHKIAASKNTQIIGNRSWVRNLKQFPSQYIIFKYGKAFYKFGDDEIPIITHSCFYDEKIFRKHKDLKVHMAASRTKFGHIVKPGAKFTVNDHFYKSGKFFTFENSYNYNLPLLYCQHFLSYKDEIVSHLVYKRPEVVRLFYTSELINRTFGKEVYFLTLKEIKRYVTTDKFLKDLYEIYKDIIISFSNDVDESERKSIFYIYFGKILLTKILRYLEYTKVIISEFLCLTWQDPNCNIYTSTEKRIESNYNYDKIIYQTHNKQNTKNLLNRLYTISKDTLYPSTTI